MHAIFVGLFLTVGTKNTKARLFDGRYTSECGVFSDGVHSIFFSNCWIANNQNQAYFVIPNDREDSHPEMGVRTLLTLAHILLRSPEEKPPLLPLLTSQQAELLDNLYGEASRQARVFLSTHSPKTDVCSVRPRS